MLHKMMMNSTNKVMRHPHSGQVVLPGQQYMVPEDTEPLELVGASLPYITVQTVANPKESKKLSTTRRA